MTIPAFIVWHLHAVLCAPPDHRASPPQHPINSTSVPQPSPCCARRKVSPTARSSGPARTTKQPPRPLAPPRVLRAATCASAASWARVTADPRRCNRRRGCNAARGSGRHRRGCRWRRGRRPPLLLPLVSSRRPVPPPSPAFLPWWTSGVGGAAALRAVSSSPLGEDHCNDGSCPVVRASGARGGRRPARPLDGRLPLQRRGRRVCGAGGRWRTAVGFDVGGGSGWWQKRVLWSRQGRQLLPPSSPP